MRKTDTQKQSGDRKCAYLCENCDFLIWRLKKGVVGWRETENEVVENGKKLENCVALSGPVINNKCDKAGKVFDFHPLPHSLPSYLLVYIIPILFLFLFFIF